jgi:hypothetical protein
LIPTSNVKIDREGRVRTLAELRILCAYLGEQTQFDWWPTAFFAPTGLKFLEYNFPRTIISAAVHSVTHAAKQLHDQRIGTAASYHLFRLPHDLEQDVHNLILQAPKDSFSPLISDGTKSLEELKLRACGEHHEAVGPVRVTAVAQLTSLPALRKIAAYYWSAFQNRSQAFPYFTVD